MMDLEEEYIFSFSNKCSKISKKEEKLFLET